jgi:hypothetical protein
MLVIAIGVLCRVDRRCHIECDVVVDELAEVRVAGWNRGIAGCFPARIADQVSEIHEKSLVRGVEGELGRVPDRRGEQVSELVSAWRFQQLSRKPENGHLHPVEPLERRFERFQGLDHEFGRRRSWLVDQFLREPLSLRRAKVFERRRHTGGT